MPEDDLEHKIQAAVRDPQRSQATNESKPVAAAASPQVTPLGGGAPGRGASVSAGSAIPMHGDDDPTIHGQALPTSSPTLPQVPAARALVDPKAANRVLLVGFWGGSELGVLKALAAVHEELNPYDLAIVTAPSFAGVTPEQVAKVMIERYVPFTALDRALIRVKGTNEL